MAPYNGHPSWNAWNVSLWINNDERMYRIAYEYVKELGVARATKLLTERWGGSKTPDGGVFNSKTIRLAIADMEL